MPAIAQIYNFRLNVTFDMNGGTGGPNVGLSSGKTSDYIPYTISVNLPSSVPTRSGYEFLGWATSASATAASYSAGGTYSYTFYDATYGETTTHTTILYAVWKHVNAYVYFNANGGSGAPSTISHWQGHSVTLPSTTPTRSGYNFLGWAKSADATTAAYLPGETYALYTTVTLYAVWTPATSEVSASNGTLGTALTISISRYVNTYKHKLEYSFGNSHGDIAMYVNTSYTWTPPLSLAAQFPNATSGTCTITCKTFDGSTLIGTKTVSITLSIPDSVKCGISTVTLSETVSGIATKFGGFVQGHSKIRVTATYDTSNAQGATVSSISITINGQTLAANNAVTNEISNYGTLSFSVTITDSRGRTETYTGTYNVYAYATPTITHKASRAAATPSSIVVEYTHGISPCGDHNDKKIEIHYKKTTEQYYTEIPEITPSAYSGTASYTITDTDPNATYLVKTIVSDAFNSVSVESKVAATGNRIVHISARKKTISLHNTNPDDNNDHEFKIMVFHEGIIIGATALTENQLRALLALI